MPIYLTFINTICNIFLLFLLQMKFFEFLIKYDIPFTEPNEGEIAVDDNLIIPFELEFRKEFPEDELYWDYLRYRVEPNCSTNDKQYL